MESAPAQYRHGLIKESGELAVLSDILVCEDNPGDMDFKVASDANGITALQA